MAWRKSIPAVLLLTLAVPTARGNSVGRAPVAAPAVRRVRDNGSARQSIRSAQSQSKRRENEADGETLSETTIAQASEHLRLGAESRVSSDTTRAEWERFYSYCDDKIRRFAATFRSRGVDVDDCTQEAWADLIRSLPQFNFDASRGRFDSWLYTIVRNKATDAIRRQSRRTTTELSPDVIDSVSTRATDPSEILDRQADRDAVRHAMDRLRDVASDSSYRVMHHRYIDEWDVPQVADALGLSREQVWVREHRMKRKLRDLLRNPFEESSTTSNSSTSDSRMIA